MLYNRIGLKFDRQLGITAAKFQSVWKNLNPNLAASRIREILWGNIRTLVPETGISAGISNYIPQLRNALTYPCLR